jgi:cobalt-zinc-cadmium efflux system outer membrane protein
MFKKKFLIFLLIYSTVALSCFSEEYKQIDLKTAMDIALQNNLDIKSYKMNVDIAENEIKIANRLQNPSISTYWNFGKAGKGNPNQLGLSQMIELGKRTPKKNLAKANYKLTAEEFEYQKFNLKMDVAEAYIKLVVAKYILKKYEHQQKFLEDLLEISNRNNLSANKTDLDTIEAKIALNQIITEVNKTKTNAKTARIEFNKIMNVPDGKYDSFDCELTNSGDVISINIPNVSTQLPSFKDIENSAIKNRYDIKLAEQQIEVANKKLSVTVRQKVPDIELSSGYGYQTIGLSDDNTYKAGAYLEANLVNIPLFYSYKPEIKNARLEVEKAKTDYISVVNKAKKDVEIAYEEFITAQLNLNSYNDSILRDSEELFNLFEKTYQLEKVDFATLAAVEESYQDLVVGYADALSDYYTGWINFLRELNTEDFSFNAQKL